MMSAEDQAARSPWITVWFKPRSTIEHLVAARPTHLVWWLAILGAIASGYSQISVLAGATSLLHGQLAIGLVLLGAFIGTIWLYLAGVMLSRIGGLLGGRAPALHMRAVFAWSMWPTILGAILVLLIGVSNAVTPDLVAPLVAVSSFWSLIVFLLMLGRVQHFGFWRTLLTYVFNVVLGLTVALLFRSFLYQPFNIPSSSMRPALLIGDYIFVSKFAYGYSRFSLPFSPRFSGRILASQPKAGDVVVFRHPKDTATDYVKRVVGLPGDRIQMKEGQLYINDALVKRERLTDVMDDGICGATSGAHVKRWRETLPNGASFETLDCVDNAFFDNTVVFTVPEGHFFVLGDNRDNSTDSRMSQVGPIPFENLIGRVSVVFFSYDAGEDGTAAHVRDDRFGKIVR